MDWRNGNADIYLYVFSADSDGDGISDDKDNCPDDYNPDQEDNELDGLGDVCDPDDDNDGILDGDDNCPFDSNSGQEDDDTDGIGNVCDNCPDVSNPDQVNSDNDSHGDACDNCPNVDNEDQADSDGNGVGDFCEATEPDCRTDDDCYDKLFCNGKERCLGGKCYPGNFPCADDGLFCNGVETCDEASDFCLHSGYHCPEGTVCNESTDSCDIIIPPEICDNLIDDDGNGLVDCGDIDDCEGIACDDEDLCTEGDTCSEGVCIGAPIDCDDGLYCNGKEICVEGVCQPDENPCSLDEICDEENDECLPPQPPPLTFDIIPSVAFRSHVIPLPLIIFIDGTDTNFDDSTTVSFSGDVIAPPWTDVVSSELIFVLSLITPTGLDDTGGSEVEVTVTTDEGTGSAILTFIILPWILDE